MHHLSKLFRPSVLALVLAPTLALAQVEAPSETPATNPSTQNDSPAPLVESQAPLVSPAPMVTQQPQTQPPAHENSCPAVHAARSSVLLLATRTGQVRTAFLFGDAQHAITASRNVRGVPSVVRTLDGTEVSFHVVARDRAHDLALLELETAVDAIPLMAAAGTRRAGEPGYVVGHSSANVDGFFRYLGHHGLRTHLQQQVTLQAVSTRWLRFGELVDPDSVGAPIVSCDGHVLGVVSHSTQQAQNYASNARHLAALLEMQQAPSSGGLGITGYGFLGIGLAFQQQTDPAVSLELGLFAKSWIGIYGSVSLSGNPNADFFEARRRTTLISGGLSVAIEVPKFGLRFLPRIGLGNLHHRVETPTISVGSLASVIGTQNHLAFVGGLTAYVGNLGLSYSVVVDDEGDFAHTAFIGFTLH